MGPLPSPAGRQSGSPLGASWQAGRAENVKTKIKEIKRIKKIKEIKAIRNQWPGGTGTQWVPERM